MQSNQVMKHVRLYIYSRQLAYLNVVSHIFVT